MGSDWDLDRDNLDNMIFDLTSMLVYSRCLYERWMARRQVSCSNPQEELLVHHVKYVGRENGIALHQNIMRYIGFHAFKDRSEARRKIANNTK